MAQNTPQPAPSRTPNSPQAKSGWRRIFAAQESGLIVVIALMMLALTVFGGSKPSPIRIEIPGTARVELRPGNVLWVNYDSLTNKTYTSETDWKIRGDLPASSNDPIREPITAFGTRSVNKFLDVENLLNVLNTASYYAIMAVGMTAIIILAGIDLSIGSIYAVAAICGALALSAIEARSPGTSALLAVPLLLLVCCSVGAVGGFLNGFSSVALRVHPFIITLGTMAIYRGIVFVTTRGQTVSGLPDSIQTGFFKWQTHGVFPIPTLITIAIGLAGAFVLSRTVFGRRVYAIGGNEVAAKYAGIPVGRVKTMVYTISGALAGLAAAIYVGYFGAAENGAGEGYELNVIAAAVIGGASLSGGRGSALGAVLGAILVQLINNGMLILAIDQSYNKVVMGLAIIIAVVVDQTKSRWTK